MPNNNHNNNDNIKNNTKGVVRASCQITRTHQRFLLRRLEFSQQYAPMYRNRIEAQFDSVLHAIQSCIAFDKEYTNNSKVQHSHNELKQEAKPCYNDHEFSPSLSRVLELIPGHPAICVGVLYKHMKLLPKFLDEYQRELIRIDAGGDDDENENEENDNTAAGIEMTEIIATEREEKLAAKEDATGLELDSQEAGLELAASNEHYTLCHSNDELLLEDSSGRIVLVGLDSTRFCTGLVIGVCGTLEANGRLRVHRYAFAHSLPVHCNTVPRLLLHTPHAQIRIHNSNVNNVSESTNTNKSHVPCYIAFVCGLNVQPWARDRNVDASKNSIPTTSKNNKNSNEKENVTNNMQSARRQKSFMMLRLLVDFICGSVSDDHLLCMARHIARLVIGGNSIAPTDELRLKKKVRLEPADHAKLNEDKLQSSSSSSPLSPSTGVTVTSAELMREFDQILSTLCQSVEVELMPGDNDMSDAFFPQQPLHPVLLPHAARMSSLRLVTNPFEFSVHVSQSTSLHASNITSTDSVDHNNSKAAETVTINGKENNVFEEVKRQQQQQEQEEELYCEEEEEEKKKLGEAKKHKENKVHKRDVQFLITSGQNVNDVARETQYATRLETMATMVAAGCMCPTAPNTLFSYPFRNVDPFVMPHLPNCFVACDQPQFETAHYSLVELSKQNENYFEKSDSIDSNTFDSNKKEESKAEDDDEEEENEEEMKREEEHDNDVSEKDHNGIRLICVPAFYRTGTLVLVDVNCATLETTMIDFSIL